LKNVNTPESVPPKIRFDKTCFLRKIPLEKAFLGHLANSSQTVLNKKFSNHLADFDISVFSSLLSARCRLQNGNVSPNGKPF
jgi:hypothetical protein